MLLFFLFNFILIYIFLKYFIDIFFGFLFFSIII